MRMLPRKLSELGRIRIGDEYQTRSGKMAPRKLSTFRFTSPDKRLLIQLSSHYGGDVTSWTSARAPRDTNGAPLQYELYANTNTLEVVIPTLSSVSVCYERWGAGGCTRRCTGEVITHDAQASMVGAICQCEEGQEEACPRVLRLNVLLDSIEGLGVWRLDTHGFYACAEIEGNIEMLRMAGQHRQMISAVLRLENRKVQREGKTRLFAVPVLQPKLSPRQIMIAHNSQEQIATESAKTLEEHVADLYGDKQPLKLQEKSTKVDDSDSDDIHTVLFLKMAAAQKRLRWTQEEWVLYQQAQQKRFKKNWDDLSIGVLDALLQEMSALAVMREQAEESQVSTKQPDQAETVSTVSAQSWRDMLASVLAELQDKELLFNAQSILEDAETQTKDGEDMLSMVLNTLDMQDRQSEIPF